MKCVICGTNHDLKECPTCHFFKFITIGNVPIEEVVKQNQQAINNYREAFLKKVEISVVAHFWKEKGGTLISDGSKSILIGTGDQLYKYDSWAEQFFAREDELEELETCISVKCESGEAEHVIKVPNLSQAKLQQIGARINENMELKVLLRNSDEMRESSFIPLFQ